MIIAHTLSGTAAVSFAVLLVSAFTPSSSFLTVKGMTVQGETVTATRGVNWDVVADWSVAVVKDGELGPSCSTIHGRDLHDGWSTYFPQPVSEKSFPMDVWVGDPGCYERLSPGPHNMFVSWTPRDGSAPVTAQTTFNK